MPVAAETIRLLAERVFPEHPSPPVVGTQRVPLLWAASAGDRDHPMVQWLLEVSSRTPVLAVAGIDMSGSAVAATGWEALLRCFTCKRDLGLG